MHDVADARIELDERASGDRRRARCHWWARRVAEGFRENGVARCRACTRCSCWRCAVARTCAGAGDSAGSAFQIRPPDKHSFGALGGGGGLVTVSALSPDCARLVFYAADQSARVDCGCVVRSTRSRRGRLPNTDEGVQPFWSPDSRSIAFFAKGRLYRSTWRAVTVVKSARSWNPREARGARPEAIVFATGNPSTFMHVASQGGKPTPIEITGAENICD